MGRLTDRALDLEGLTQSPEKEVKEARRENKFGREILGKVKVSKISANKVILWEEPATSMPLISG